MSSQLLMPWMHCVNRHQSTMRCCHDVVDFLDFLKVLTMDTPGLSSWGEMWDVFFMNTHSDLHNSTVTAVLFQKSCYIESRCGGALLRQVHINYPSCWCPDCIASLGIMSQCSAVVARSIARRIPTIDIPLLNRVAAALNVKYRVILNCGAAPPYYSLKYRVILNRVMAASYCGVSNIELHWTVLGLRPTLLCILGWSLRLHSVNH